MGALHLITTTTTAAAAAAAAATTTTIKGRFYGIRRFTIILMGLWTLNGIGILSMQYDDHGEANRRDILLEVVLEEIYGCANVIERGLDEDALATLIHEIT